MLMQADTTTGTRLPVSASDILRDIPEPAGGR